MANQILAIAPYWLESIGTWVFDDPFIMGSEQYSPDEIVLIADPGPLTGQVMTNAALPFTVTLITNGQPESRVVVARRKPPFSAEASRPEPLNLAWPPDVISLSHVALRAGSFGATGSSVPRPCRRARRGRACARSAFSLLCGKVR